MPNTELLVRAAVAALNAGHDIRASSELALRMQLAVAELEQERLYYQIEALEAELVAARAGTPDGTAWLNERLAYEQGEREREGRRAAQWRKLAKLRRQQVRDLETAVARRDERIRIQDGAITRLTASRDRALAGVPDAPAVISIAPNPTPPILPFACEHCAERFSTRRGLATHRRAMHGAVPVQDGLKRCRICNEWKPVHAYAPSLWATQTTPPCSACERQRARNKRRADRGDMCFACDVCGETFTNRQGLGSHRRTHTTKATPPPPTPEPEPLPFEPEPDPPLAAARSRVAA